MEKMVPGAKLFNEHSQLTEKVGENDGTESVEERSDRYLRDAARLQIVAHQVQAGRVGADPVLVVEVLLEDAEVLPAVDCVERRHPKLFLLDNAVPETTLNVHVQQQEKCQFDQLEHNLDMTLRIHVPNDAVKADDADQLEASKQLELFGSFRFEEDASH